jgi:protein TonB
VSASAVAYLVPPTGEMPRLSRRAREQGTVWLHVVVDTQGLPSQIRVSKSSGYTRLDDHAVEAMRKARFKPHSQNDVAIEIQVTTPIEYSLDN